MTKLMSPGSVMNAVPRILLGFSLLAMLDWIAFNHLILEGNPYTRKLSFHTAAMTALCCLYLIRGEKEPSGKTNRFLWLGLGYNATLLIPELQQTIGLGTASPATQTAFACLFTAALSPFHRGLTWNSSLHFVLFAIIQAIGVTGLSSAFVDNFVLTNWGFVTHLSPATSLILMIFSPLMFTQSCLKSARDAEYSSLASKKLAIVIFFVPVGMVAISAIPMDAIISHLGKTHSIPPTIGLATMLSTLGLFYFAVYAAGKESQANLELKRQKQAEEKLLQSEERFQLAMEGTRDGLWDWDVIASKTYFSPGYSSMLGYKPEELENHFDTWLSLLHPEDREMAVTSVQKAMADHSTTSMNNTFRLAHKDGRWIRILARGRILRNSKGEVVRIVGTHVDRSEVESLRQEAEQAWMVAQTEAESNDAKSKFLATVSHEIRNPLSSVTGYARLIEDAATDPEIRGYAHILNQTALNLTLTLNDLLDFAKIEAGKLEIVSLHFDLEDVLQPLVESSKMLCREKGIKFQFSQEFSGTGWFQGDAHRIRQVLQNLLSNAIKFTTEGQVRFSVSSPETTESSHSIQFEVSDTGIGIDSGKLDKLFKPFSQTHSDASGKFGGTGLGLTIVKALSEAMGGAVRVESQKGKGSKFTVSIPLQTGAPQAKPRAIPNRGGRPKHILVADDMPTNAKVLEAILRKKGHKVCLAYDGKQALEYLNNEQFDFALLDIDMPHLSGLDVVKKVRSKEGVNRTLKFGCISGHALNTSVEKALAEGFDYYFPKPLDMDAILKTIAELG